MSAHPRMSNRGRLMAIFAVAAVAMAGFVPSASAAATAKEKALRRQINNYRQDRGRGTLKMQEKLRSYAHKHSKAMASDNRFDQVGDHSSTSALQNLAADANCEGIAELIDSTGDSEDTVAALLQDWKDSDTHNATLLERRWKRIGTGIFVDNGTLWGTVILCDPQ